MHIHELHLATSDVAAQHAFYHGVLHMPVRAASAAEFMLQAGDTRLTFTQAAQGETPRYHFAFNVPPQQFAEAKAWLAARTPLLADHTGTNAFFSENWNASMIYFRDPAGNIGELIARHTLHDAPQEPFSARSLLRVSEIGLASDDVPATVAMLGAALGVAVYRDSVSDTFTAIGDEHGLFIVVRRGREWYPETGTPAEFVPVSAVISMTNDAPRFTLGGPPYHVQPAHAFGG